MDCLNGTDGACLRLCFISSDLGGPPIDIKADSLILCVFVKNEGILNFMKMVLTFLHMENRLSDLIIRRLL